ncbi:hypothetical protein Lbir_2172 [Legionella birminghamensis]|uniref:Uncharacterized protein n=1 Tax=Legionella birminghamensis TaxID=28083 RepID=A0A378IHL3_9GAMM|nr:hypothetical protein [Legionella birminghamensis]KTC69433.1 hypothetical protein Lbir_2172 [Legionella birminghamensis]STX31674.1 Uncharacterised protein [Legionella birminghamensis]
MKKVFLALALLPVLCFAKCVTPWEDVKSSVKDILVCRLEVPNGWLLQTSYWYTSTVIFVPDEKHEWVLDTNS